MAKHSAGILIYRTVGEEIEVFLVHPGGPFWKNKDLGSWSVPNGEFDPNSESSEEAARREFEEETGILIQGVLTPLTPIKQNDKTISVWVQESNIDPKSINSNQFAIEWPPKSGQQRQFPEIDRAEWFKIPEALKRIVKPQRGFLQELCKMLGKSIDDSIRELEMPMNTQGELFN
jgi:predicted NUDIX family NTP pyrophosphohydrolase